MRAAALLGLAVSPNLSMLYGFVAAGENDYDKHCN